MTAEDMFKANPIIPEGVTRQACIAFMKTFAKYHVKQALKEAVNNMKDGYVTEEDEEDILNCYPLTNIE